MNASILASVLFFGQAAGLAGTVVGPLEVGSASGEPGEVVDLPVHFSSSHPLCSFSVLIRYDREGLDFLGYDIEGSEAEGVDPHAVRWVVFEDFGGSPEETAMFGILSGCGPDDHRIGPGERLLLGHLRFRVSGGAVLGETPVQPIEYIDDLLTTTTFTLEVDGAWESFGASFAAGHVTVLPPTRPRPVYDLGCSQHLDRMELLFSVSDLESYDGFAVLRDGALVATLPAEARSHMEPIPQLGRHAYSVVGLRGEESSLSTSCEVLVVAPAAPPPRDLQCLEGGTLTWRNAAVYEHILVLKNGEFIAELPGNARSFEDGSRPDGLTIYSVIGELEGFRSPEATCIAEGVWIMEAGDVRVPVGTERVEIPIYVTTPEPVEGLQVLLRMDLGRFALIADREAALEGTVGPDPEFLGIGVSPSWGLPITGIIYTLLPPRKNLAVGLRQRVVNFAFRRVVDFANGDSVQVPIVEWHVGDRRKGSLFAVPSSDSIRANFYIPGEIRFGTSGPAEPLGLHWILQAPGVGAGGAAADGGAGTDVVLRWQNGTAYDAVRIERNGTALAELAGSATEFTDAGVPGGVYTYKVRGVVAGKTTFPARVFLSTLSPPGSFLRGDANGDGRIDMSDAMATLSFLFLGSSPVRCDDGADADDDGEITISDPINTLDYLFLGTSVPGSPGTTFPWFDPTPDTLGCRR